MKQIAKRGLALLMVLVMSFSLLSVLPITADAATTATTVSYKTSSDGYIYNWGKRGTVATFLSPNAEAFYTETTYTELSALLGNSNTDYTASSALYQALQTLMVTNHTHKTSYEETKTLYQYTDCENSGDPSTISSFYSGTAIGPNWGSSPSWNREHTWPNSKGLAGDDENDIMMLRPTASNENTSRGNKAYGASSDFYNPNSVSGGTYDLRGDVARIFLYVYVRWGNVNGNGEYTTWGSTGVFESKDLLIEWMAADPVDTWELGRNDSVESITGTRNVFVDYPELAFLLFNAEIPTTMATPSGAAANAGSGHTHSFTSTVTKSANCTEAGVRTYTCSGCSASYTETIPATGHNVVDGTCTVCKQPVDPDKTVKIYYPAGDLYITSTASGNKLSPGTESQAAVWTMTQDGDYYTFSVDGKYLTSGTTGGSLTLSASATDYSLWALEDAGSGNYYLRNAKAAYNSKPQYVEYYKELFTTYSFQTSTPAIHTFQLKEVSTECDHNYENGTCTKCGEEDPNYVPPANESWTLVTDVSTLKAGDQIIIAAKDYDHALSTNQKSNNRGSAAVTKSGNTVTFGSDVQIITLEAGTKTGTFAFKVDTGYLYAASGSKNYLRTESALSDNSSWLITIASNGTATVVAQGSNGRNTMQYNLNTGNGDPLFACYAGATQKAIVIYVLTTTTVEPTPCEHTNTTVKNAKEATCKVEGYTGDTFCIDCEKTITTGTSIPVTNDHNYVDGKCTVCNGEDPDYTPPATETETWTLVTDASTLAVGDKIIIVTAGSTSNALSTTQNNNNRGSVAVTKDGDTVTFGDGVQIITLEAGKNDNTFAFKVDTGYLYAASSSKNYLKTKSALDANGSWSVSISSKGVATIKAQGTNTKNWMRYNTANGGIFACYSSGQMDISIYKLTVTVVAPPCKHTNTSVVGAKEATCKVEGYTGDIVCGDCGETITTGTSIPVTDHSYTSAVTTPATCTTEGVRTYTCTCGDSYTESIPVIDHSYTCVTTPATCTVDGVHTYTCTCGDSYTETIPATGHKFVNFVCSCGETLYSSNPPSIAPPVGDTQTGICTGDETCVLSGFSDVKATAWYHDGMHYCVANGLLSGLPGKLLAPGLTASRAQIVTMMWRMAGTPMVNYMPEFDDVASQSWYTAAVRWAAFTNISDGYGNGVFGTSDDITREQFVTMLYRYAGSPAVSGDYLSRFPDADKISSWAKDAMNWAISVGLLNGNGAGELNPSNTATRAEVATILMRFAQNIAK